MVGRAARMSSRMRVARLRLRGGGASTRHGSIPAARSTHCCCRSHYPARPSRSRGPWKPITHERAVAPLSRRLEGEFSAEDVHTYLAPLQAQRGRERPDAVRAERVHAGHRARALPAAHRRRAGALARHTMRGAAARSARAPRRGRRRRAAACARRDGERRRVRAQSRPALHVRDLRRGQVQPARQGGGDAGRARIRAAPTTRCCCTAARAWARRT